VRALDVLAASDGAPERYLGAAWRGIQVIYHRES